MKKSKIISLGLIVLLIASLFVIMPSASDFEDFEYNAVDYDSNDDGVANKGLNSSSCINAKTKNGIFQNITEEDQVGAKKILSNGLIGVPNPLNPSEIIYLNTSEGNFQELYQSRRQSFQHFYNISSASYTFKSNLAVEKNGVLDKTDWVLQKEFPIRFVVRLKNGSIYFKTLTEVISLFSEIDNSSLWGVGVEGFKGLMGFYLDFEAEKCFGQYLYYCRFKNGSLPAYNMPLIQIFPHLFVNLSSVIYDKIFVPSSNVQNRVRVNNQSGVLEVYYTFQDVYLTKTFQFKRGFKYNVSKAQFSYINEFKCLDQDFSDVGFAYEFDRSELTDNTPLRPFYFTVWNDTFQKTINVTEALDFKNYVSNSLNKIAIESFNRKWSFIFDFEDMKDAGFSKSYLSIHNQSMPSGDFRNVLRVGMFNYGSYSQNTVISIDPTFSEKQEDDDMDFEVYTQSGYYYSTLNADNFRVGWGFSATFFYHGVCNFKTGITDVISEISSVTFTFYIISETSEASEYLDLLLYDNLDDDEVWNESEILGDEEEEDCFLQAGYYTEYNVIEPNGNGGSNVSITGATALGILDAWVEHHNDSSSDRSIIGLKLLNGTGLGFGDYATIAESTIATASQRPTLEFTYTLYSPPSNDFELEWEHKIVDIESRTYYNLSIWGFSNESEVFLIQLWNSSSSAWVDTSWNISITQQWYNFSLGSYSSLIVGNNLTYRFKDEDQSSDSSVSKLVLDYSGLTGFNDLDTTPDFVAWFQSYTLIVPYNNVEFYVVIEDKDNSSSEISAKMFYSNDSFATVNVSCVMNYESTPSANHYRYNYIKAGEAGGVYYEYYYYCTDNITVRKKPSEVGVYYTIQWDIEVTTSPPVVIPGETTVISLLPLITQITTDYMPIIILVVLAVIVVLIIIFATRKKKKY